MNPFVDDGDFRLYVGDVREVARRPARRLQQLSLFAEEAV